MCNNTIYNANENFVECELISLFELIEIRIGHFADRIYVLFVCIVCRIIQFFHTNSIRIFSLFTWTNHFNLNEINFKTTKTKQKNNFIV